MPLVSAVVCAIFFTILSEYHNRLMKRLEERIQPSLAFYYIQHHMCVTIDFIILEYTLTLLLWNTHQHLTQFHQVVHLSLLLLLWSKAPLLLFRTNYCLGHLPFCWIYFFNTRRNRKLCLLGEQKSTLNAKYCVSGGIAVYTEKKPFQYRAVSLPA